MKKIFGTIAFLSFLFLLGTVGSVEHGMIPLGTGVIRIVAGLAAFWLFTWLAGRFDYSFDEDEESRPRCCRPKGGKRKSSF